MWCFSGESIILNYFVTSLLKCHLGASKLETSSPSVLYIIEPGDTYACKWTGSILFQVMACCLFHIKPLLESVMSFVNLNFTETLRWNLNQNMKIYYQEDAFKMSSACINIHSQPIISNENAKQSSVMFWFLVKGQLSVLQITVKLWMQFHSANQKSDFQEHSKFRIHLLVSVIGFGFQ